MSKLTLETIDYLLGKAEKYCEECIGDCYECHLKDFLKTFKEHIETSSLSVNKIACELEDSAKTELLQRVENRLVADLRGELFSEAVKWVEREAKVLKLSPEEIERWRHERWLNE